MSVIALMTRAGLPITQWLPLLIIYNVLFVTPPIALMLAYDAAGAFLAPYYQRLSRWIEQHARESLSWLVAAFGFLLMLDAGLYFLFRWVDLPTDR
jgi:hypothetical protein